jgi:hypothetical protein
VRGERRQRDRAAETYDEFPTPHAPSRLQAS